MIRCFAAFIFFKLDRFEVHKILIQVLFVINFNAVILFSLTQINFKLFNHRPIDL